MFERLYPESNPFFVKLRDKELFAHNLRNSYTYRVGEVALWPLKTVRRLWRALRGRIGAS
jgi:hypothetical protein